MVNDSTDYQVYNNSGTAGASTEAVRETAGEVLKYKGIIVTTYYYSTSCGKTTTMKAGERVKMKVMVSSVGRSKR